MTKDNTLYCSFCGNSQHDVLQLLAGPTVFICDECVDLCAGIVAQERERRANPIVPKGAKLTCPRGHVWGDDAVTVFKPKRDGERPIVACPICFTDLIAQQLGEFGALFDVAGEYAEKGWPLGTIELPAQGGDTRSAETAGLGPKGEHAVAEGDAPNLNGAP